MRLATYPSGMDSIDLKRKTIIVTHKVFIIAFNSHVDEISIFLPHGFDVFLLRFDWFFPARVCWFSLNNPSSEFTMHERSKSYV